MHMSGDIMGRANMHIEDLIGGVALFVNADAGGAWPALLVWQLDSRVRGA
jgi:hypothetical protein